MNFVDIHTHVLPGVDDGAASIDETIAMLRMAYDGGTRKIVATPHMFFDLFKNNDFVEIRDRFDQLTSDLNSYQDTFPFLKAIEVYPGAENYASPEFLEALGQGCVLTLNGSRYLLVEFSPMLPFSQIENVIQRVFAAGYTPVIAHSERYAAIQEDPMRMVRFWEMGCVTQVNADSLLGGWGSRATKCAKALLEEGLVNVIASDGHRVRWRPPVLEGVFGKLESEYAGEDVAAWMVENPQGILANESLEVSYPAKDPTK
ncbi:hypothetical protein MYX75_06410 [Acidobacteria bacterium AH-259-A15]|nr:hypothetical protein [Acidobacteria bacterium AH-259-A15]